MALWSTCTLGPSDSRRRQYNTPPASRHPLRDFLTLLPLHEYLVCHSLLSIFTVAGVQANPFPLFLGPPQLRHPYFLFHSHPTPQKITFPPCSYILSRPAFFPLCIPCPTPCRPFTHTYTHNYSTSCLLNYYLPLRQPLLREQPLSMSCLDQKSQPGSPKRSRG